MTTQTTLTTDYLVIGTGAVGMAFVDTLLDETDANIIMVDNHHQPGGHWNDAYPFVRLHQPSHFYGVPSTPLGNKTIDQSGSNKGYFELASGAEVLTYFDQVMRQRFLPSGRVQYFPMSEYEGDGCFRNMMSDARTRVTVRQRIVDTSFFKTSVPSRHTKRYELDAAVKCIAPNQLPLDASGYKNYCVIGAGKTAMDSCVWLIENGADPDHINWVKPRESWIINRDVTQADASFFSESIGSFANQMEAIAEGTSAEDIFDRLEACGFMLRIDKTLRPTMFHFATISQGEINQLSRITNVIRQGRVVAVNRTGLTMQSGDQVPLPEQTLYVDCTASAVDFVSHEARPVFEPGAITIQALRAPNPCLSAAMIAYIEANYEDDEQRNQLSQPVPLPDNAEAWLKCMLGNMTNQAIWSGEPALSQWITACRVDGFATVIQNADTANPEHLKILEKLGQNVGPAMAKLQQLVNQSAD